MTRRCFGISNRASVPILGLLIIGLLTGRRRPSTPYSPYYGAHGLGDFFVGDFRDVSEIESLS